jgi:hypothetical protein
MQDDRTKKPGATTARREAAALDGASVYDVTGKQIGKIIGGTRDGAYLTLAKGLLFSNDYYLSTSVTARADGKSVFLNVSPDEIQSSGWQDPPVGYDTAEQFREHSGEIRSPAQEVLR